MANYNIRVDLSKLNKVTTMDIQGNSGKVKCVVIPIEENGIFVSERTGAIYLDFSAYQSREERYGQTHQVKLKIGGERWRNMTPEERRAIPICGNLAPFDGGNGGYQDNTPQPSTSQSSSNFGSYSNNDSSNLPF